MHRTTTPTSLSQTRRDNYIWPPSSQPHPPCSSDDLAADAPGHSDDCDLEAAVSNSDAASASDGGGSGSGSGGGAAPAAREPTALETGAKAAALLAGGTALCAVFADPLVGTVADVSRASGVAPFFLAFVFMPLASNASELVSSLAFAAAQTTSHMSVTFNQVYGAAVLNSTLCLGCFLAVLAHQRLPWTFGPEVAVILLPTLLLGAFACRRRSWPAAWGAGALAMYPLALLLQWGLTRLAARA